MKRLHIDEQERKPLPEGLVFYAPLTRDNLTDCVSGNIFVNADGGLAYDINEGAYLVTIPSAIGQKAAYITVPHMGISTKLTSVYEYKEVGNANFRVGYFSPDYAQSDIYPYALAFTFGGARGSAGRWKKFVQTWDNGSFKAWKDGILYNTQIINTAINSNCNSGISIGCKTGQNHSGSYYLKNLQIYNRLLTDEEIAQL